MKIILKYNEIRNLKFNAYTGNKLLETKKRK